MDKLRADAKHMTLELTDCVSQLSKGKRTPKEALRWFTGLEKRLTELEKRAAAENDDELNQYLTRSRRLADKSLNFINKKMADEESGGGEGSSKDEPSYARLGRLLIAEDNLTLVKALGLCAKATSAEKLGKVVLRLFRDNGQELRLIRACIEAELLAATSSQGTMFRRNSLNSVCLASYARAIGGDYLKSALQPTMTKLTTGAEDYELDPSKTASGVVPTKNLMNVVARVEEFLNLLLSTVKNMPRELGYVCHVLASTVCRVMPDARNTAIGGLLMLRFFCPAMASPENAGLASLPQERKRGLIVLSKVIINLSNNVELGKKEAFMAPLDPLLDGARHKLQSFYDCIVDTFFEDCDVGIEIPAHLELANEQMLVVHSYLEEKKALEELDEAITNHVDLGLDQHTPLKLRQALSRCPPLVPRISGAGTEDRSSGASLGTSHLGLSTSSSSQATSPIPSPNHSPQVARRAAPAPPALKATGSASGADLRVPAGPTPQQRRWSGARAASAGVLSAPQDEMRKSPRSGAEKPSLSSSHHGHEDHDPVKSPRIVVALQRLVKREPDHDEGYVSTVFSDTYDPDAE